MNFMNGLMQRTGVIIVILAFLYQQVGLSKEDAENTIAIVTSIIGGVIALLGYIRKVINYLKAKKVAKAAVPANP